MGEAKKIPAVYDGGEQLLVVAHKNVNGEKEGEEIPKEDQEKQVEEARKHAEEIGGFIYDTATLYPGFSVAFKPGTVHSLADVDAITHEPASGAVFANK
ncbi:hypothetical protein BOTNAR_0411g00090 [Botryotinia narcissicola]|uniref:Inhibitor I9 domain-containing protein n=1 Tax=Botryotinia narcissicola TaxID=278944 RepID=A0A4Z1HMR0_9HELO|nr:hypothetical protein BOTNAR_0411g00090 [Botryotinia narcissicola]